LFSNVVDFSVDHVELGPFQPDHLRTPFIIDCGVPVRRCKQNFNIPYERFSVGDYVVLYNPLSTYDGSSLYNETSAGAAVAKATDLAVPSGYIKKHKYLAWFSGKLKVNIKKKNYFYRRYKKYKADCFYDKFSFHSKWDKTTIKTGRYRWHKS
jgi:hypothetical protein